MSRQRLTPTIPHPALVEHARERAALLQNRIADRITRYAGSMHFVYLHIALFAVWMILIEESPWPTLTLIARPSNARTSAAFSRSWPNSSTPAPIHATS